MAIYTTKLCPHCGHFYQSYSTATKNMTVKQGCPIVCCTKCGESFLDKDIKEPAFSPPEEGELNIFQMIVGLLFPFGVAGIFFLILGIVYKSMPAALISLIPFAFYAYLLYVGIKNKKEINDDIKIAYKKSKDRLSNKDYVVELIELGYKVPLSFLEYNYPELIDKKSLLNRFFDATNENDGASTNQAKVESMGKATFQYKCEMCDCGCNEITYAKITDEMGVRYRNLCNSCMKEFNATPTKRK